MKRSELEERHRVRLAQLRCPKCGFHYTDAAARWSQGWLEGRRDALAELGLAERCGFTRLRCELCDHRAWIEPFTDRVLSQRPTDTPP